MVVDGTEPIQKFHYGDFVRIAKDLGPHMAHFESDRDAIVIGSYKDKYDGDGIKDHKDYTLFLKGSGEVSWYDEHQLTLIQSDRKDLLDIWKEEDAKDQAEKSDLDWIFTHGPELVKDFNGTSAQALGSCFGLTDLWGSRGEGIVFYHNSRVTYLLAEPFLLKNDKDGWLDICSKIKQAMLQDHESNSVLA